VLRNLSSRRGAIGLALTFVLGYLFVSAAAAVVYNSGLTLIDQSQWVSHTHEVLANLEGAEADLNDAESSQRIFVITGDPIYLQRYGAQIEATRTRLERVRELVADNPPQQRKVQELEAAVARRLGQLDRVIQARSSGFESARATILREGGPQLAAEVRARSDAIKREEDRLLSVRQARTNASTQSAVMAFWGVRLIDALMFLGLYMLTRRTVDVLRQSRDQEHLSRAELERRVERRTAELRAANEELESFSYSVAHDLRSPLRHIGGLAEGLKQDLTPKLTGNEQGDFERIERETRRASRLLDDLLRLSRTTRGELIPVQVDLSSLVVDALRDVRARHPRERIDLVIKPEVMVEADSRMLYIAIDNLIRNAWKYTSKQEVPRIEFGDYQAGGERVFFVKDNGAGFDMDLAARLFEPFQRLHSNQEFEGNGVGLAICQRIIARHGGRIWAEGKPGEGASFYFTLG